VLLHYAHTTCLNSKGAAQSLSLIVCQSPAKPIITIDPIANAMAAELYLCAFSKGRNANLSADIEIRSSSKDIPKYDITGC
jgi:hypothetical protein